MDFGLADGGDAGSAQVRQDVLGEDAAGFGRPPRPILFSDMASEKLLGDLGEVPQRSARLNIAPAFMGESPGVGQPKGRVGPQGQASATARLG
jgi:hypothetical protein